MNDVMVGGMVMPSRRAGDGRPVPFNMIPIPTTYWYRDTDLLRLHLPYKEIINNRQVDLYRGDLFVGAVIRCVYRVVMYVEVNECR